MTSDAVILGAGLAGLSAGHLLSESGAKITIVEKDTAVGGLARTIDHNGFRFDLGGHRFLTDNAEVERFVLDILKDDFLVVPRRSRIYMFDKYFDYPLKPMNALFGLGAATTAKIISDYCRERLRNALNPRDIVSLEDWVVDRFGRKMFDLYFKQYSEKVWGVDCKCISREWVARRIKGLSLWEAVKNAFFRSSGRQIATLADSFIYPRNGIGEIAGRLRESIESGNTLLTGTGVEHIYHEDFSVRGVTVRKNKDVCALEATEFVSSIPLTNLVRMLRPSAPDDVLEAADGLNYRDLVIVTVMLDRERVNDLTWVYLPEKGIPLGRIHEPKNWSPHMAPEGKTHVVAEYFCFQGDAVWSTSDERLTAVTVDHLDRLGFINRREVIDSRIVRVPKAYPLLDVGYSRRHNKILRYLQSFKNLHVIGRGGTFSYLNMDHAIETGLETARSIIEKGSKKERINFSPCDAPL